ncbi:transposase family protein [Streptomyces sp. C10]|uniref:helix-turn-helix domain-containing protein n=1 Tax=Streptomyces sp. C10 TaxID=531941 RepID=UPI00398129D7
MGAGAKHRLVFVDRLLVTLVHLRHGTTHDVLACWFGVDRSTVTRAVGEVRPLLAERGCTVTPGIRLRTLAEVVDHLDASGGTGIIDGYEMWCALPESHGGTHLIGHAPYRQQWETLARPPTGPSPPQRASPAPRSRCARAQPKVATPNSAPLPPASHRAHWQMMSTQPSRHYA